MGGPTSSSPMARRRLRWRRARPDYANRLYRNDGDMRFTDVTEAAGVQGAATRSERPRQTTTTTAASISSSPASRTNQLYRNRGNGRFEDVTQAAGIASGDFGVAAAWFDYDNDGRLDLFVVNYVQWSPDTNRSCGDDARADPHLLPSPCLPGVAEPLVSESRRRHVRGCFGASRSAEARGQGHERRRSRTSITMAVRTCSSRTTRCRTSCSAIMATARSKKRRCLQACRCPIPAGQSPAWASMLRITTTTAGRTSSSRRWPARPFRSSATTRPNAAGRSSKRRKRRASQL